MLDLITGGNGTLAMIGAVIVGALAVLWKVFRTGRAVERGRAAMKDNKGWKYADKKQQEAADARRAARKRNDTGGLYGDDGHKRS